MRELRKARDKRILGVAGGMAEYFEMDPTLMRALWIVACFVVPPALLAYLVLGIVLPEAPLPMYPPYPPMPGMGPNGMPGPMPWGQPVPPAPQAPQAGQAPQTVKAETPAGESTDGQPVAEAEGEKEGAEKSASGQQQPQQPQGQPGFGPQGQPGFGPQGQRPGYGYGYQQPPYGYQQPPYGYQQPGYGSRPQKQMTKSTNKWVSGVAGGIAEYFDLDPVLVRALFLAGLFAGGFGLLVYIVLAIVMPEPGLRFPPRS